MVKKENGLSEYEIQRQEKIAKNQELLKKLQLDAASAGLAPPPSRSKSTVSKSTTRSKPKPRVQQEAPIATRSSSRLKGIVADSEVAKRKAEEERDAREQEIRAKRQRVSDNLRLGDIVVAGQSWDQSGNWLRNVGPAAPNERTYDKDDAIRATTNKELRELREKMSSLELWEGFEPNRIKITPERIYSMGFHPSEEKALLFAGDKIGNLGLFDASQNVEDGDEMDDESSPAITTFKPHTRTISAMFFDPKQPNAMYTASYDSSIRKLDLEKATSIEIYGPDSNDVEEPISGVQIPSNEPHMLYFTTLNGLFGMHDTRTAASSSTTQLMSLSDKKIGGFSIHPLHPHLAATASLDRTLKLWDLRKITGRGDSRLPALVAEHESKLSVSSAAFNSSGQIATSSYDDTIKIHDLKNCSSWSSGQPLAENEFDPSKIIPHNNQTGRWVTILRPQWQANPSPVGGGTQRFCIGNMNRFVDVYAGGGEQLAQLGGEGITAVPAVANFHPSCDWIAGGTASGKLCLWM